MIGALVHGTANQLRFFENGRKGQFACKLLQNGSLSESLALQFTLHQVGVYVHV